MSRIHEALKRAEQERSAAQGASTQPGSSQRSTIQPGFETLAAGETSAPFEDASGAPGSVPTLAMPLPGTSSIDAMLARCPQLPWNPDPTTTLFINGNDMVRGAEEFRTLRSRLYHLREQRPLKKILITSALPKEGKSFTSVNLAQVLVRQHGRRVLLIDADLRGPRLHLMLGTTSSPGLSDYLHGETDEFSIMQRGPVENLFFIPSGNEIADPAELVGNGRLKILMQRVEAMFDWIIIDSPPAVPVSDSGLLAKACDGVLMVVRSNSTPVDMARRARMEFPEQALLGVVLNGIREGPAQYQRYYYEAYGTKGNTAKP
jgi:capsular exopolysaccharide synthesis family protein